MSPLLLAVGVDAAAAHAGLFDRFGKLGGAASAPFDVLRPAPDQAVHRMDAIWTAAAAAIRECIARVPDAGSQLAGIGFSAVPALVLGHDGPPPLAGDADVFALADRRAAAEAAELAGMGQAVAASMHLPRLLWLRRRAPATWARVTAARDLCDALGWRATGIDAASFGSLLTQWPFDAEGGWRQALLDAIRLDDLPMLVAPPRRTGELHGPLAPAAAAELGLEPGLPVAVGLPDDHAAALGVLGRGAWARLNRTLVVVACDPARGFAFAPDRREIEGARGPFRDALLPGYWLQIVEPATAEVVELLNASGYAIDRVTIAGDIAIARSLFAADLVMTEILRPALSGAAMAAAVAAAVHPDLSVALDLMSPRQVRFAGQRRVAGTSRS